MNNEHMKAKEVTIKFPFEVFEESGIPADGGFEIYCREGEIVIKELIEDELLCAEDCENCTSIKDIKCNNDCENCPCYDKKNITENEKKHGRTVTISITLKDSDNLEFKALLERINTTRTNDIYNHMSQDELVRLVFCLSLKLGEIMATKKPTNT